MAGYAAAGSIGAGLIGLGAQHSANQANIKLNRENRDWMERMSNTEYQRAVKDMLNAGLNPMLANITGGASTPSNSAATVQPEDAIARGVNSAASAALQASAIEQQRANVKLTEAQTYKAQQEGNLAAFNAFPDIIGKRYDQEIELNRQAIEAAKTKNRLTAAEAEQVEQMLPFIMQQQIAQTRATEQSTSSAKVKQRLDELAIPESEVAARWFSSEIGGGSRITQAIKDIITIIRMSGRK